jgi:ribosome biogenesis GTPase / thiamine phosphate phosphatase
MARRHFDERDARSRPPRSTRPRSKERPDHADAQIAMVINVERGRYLCITADSHEVSAMKARELGKNSIVVGDQVGLVGDLSGNEGSLARIVRVLERKNSLTRTIDVGERFEKTIAANVDQMVIVASVIDPEPRTGFIDRCLAVAYDQGILPILVMTKSDLGDPEKFLVNYRSLDLTIFVTRKGGDIGQLSDALSNRTSVMIGHSGVGKSTLVNAIVGGNSRRTGDVNLVTGRGRHTSSSAIALRLPSQGWIIDTPGVRSFGLEHVDVGRIIASFTDLGEVVARCPKNCSHDEIDCALNDYVKRTPESAERIASLRRVLASRLQPIT